MLDFTLQLNKTNKDKHDAKKIFSQSRKKNTYVIDQKQSQPWDSLKRSPRTMQLKKSPAKSPAYI